MPKEKIVHFENEKLSNFKARQSNIKNKTSLWFLFIKFRHSFWTYDLTSTNGRENGWASIKTLTRIYEYTYDVQTIIRTQFSTCASSKFYFTNKSKYQKGVCYEKSCFRIFFVLLRHAQRSQWSKTHECVTEYEHLTCSLMAYLLSKFC